MGKAFVLELARLFDAFATKSALKSIALKAAILMAILLLQKLSHNSKTKDCTNCLERRLTIWQEGDLEELLREGRTIQQRSSRTSSCSSDNRLPCSFANLMFQGKVHAAMRLLHEQADSGKLHLNDVINTEKGQEKVRDILSIKHPPGQDVHTDAVIDDMAPSNIHPIIFEALDSDLIKHAALRTHGAAGPSGLDALQWRRMYTSFKSTSVQLCRSLALTARRICTETINPSTLAPLMAGRLIALNKNPGVRPIGVGDVTRCNIAKAILNILKRDIQDVVGSAQVCVGQISGIEAAVHAVQSLFECPENEALLLVDASNAFNSLNRKTALINIQRLCLSIAIVLINTYRAPTELFVDGDVILSQEGTTQGDPLAMIMYALATIPLIWRLKDSVNDVSQV